MNTIAALRLRTPSSVVARLDMTKFAFGGFFHFSNSAIFLARSRCFLNSSSSFCLRLCSYTRVHATPIAMQVDETVVENEVLFTYKFSTFLQSLTTFSVLTLLVGWQEGHPTCKFLALPIPKGFSLGNLLWPV